MNRVLQSKMRLPDAPFRFMLDLTNELQVKYCNMDSSLSESLSLYTVRGTRKRQNNSAYDKIFGTIFPAPFHSKRCAAFRCVWPFSKSTELRVDLADIDTNTELSLRVHFPCLPCDTSLTPWVDPKVPIKDQQLQSGHRPCV